MTQILITAGVALDRAWPALSPAAGKARREQAAQLLPRLAGYGREHGLDALIIAGDLFDRQTVMPASLNVAATALDAFGGPVVIVPGQRDWWSTDSPYALGAWPRNVHIANPNTAAGFHLGDDLHLSASPWTSASQPRPSTSDGNAVLHIQPGLDMPPTQSESDGPHLVTTALTAESPITSAEAPRLTVVQALLPEPGVEGGAVAQLAIEGRQVSELKDVRMAVSGDLITLDVTSSPTSEALVVQIARTIQGAPPASVVRLTGTLSHGVLLPDTQNHAFERDDVIVDTSQIGFTFPKPDVTQRSTTAEFVRALADAPADDRQRHQAIALGLHAMVTNR